ncbi:AAA family ATPase [Parafilimonas sp.]|uniref:AAA family ATPase n=1 Tax=Parafilimonas sp. TaxID=1969739 RepID=UPI0039E63851
MNEEIFEQRINLEDLNKAMFNLQSEIKKVIVGQDDMVRLIMVALLANGHVLIEGVPGVAKTLTARLVSKCLKTGFSRIQFTPDLMPSDVLGTNIFNPGTGLFEFKHGPVFSNIVLIDEINRAPAKTQAALFEVMQEQQVTMDGITHIMQNPFMVIATQNPIEQEGTYRLPEAQLDRFLFKIIVPYPNEAQEVSMLQRFHHFTEDNVLNIVEPVISDAQVVHLRQLIKHIVVEEKLIHFIVKIAVATRNDKAIYLGASPRATLAILNAAKAYAALSGRDFVIPDDIIYIARPVLRHRIILAPEKEMEGINEDEVIEKIIHSIEVPR